MGYDVTRFEGEVDDELLCSICSKVLEDPLEISVCEHVFCGICIQEYFRNENNNVCPIDMKDASANDLRPVPRLLRNMLDKLQILCEYAAHGCRQAVKLEALAAHVAACGSNPELLAVCEGGCGIRVSREDLPAHNCVAELRDLLAALESTLAEVSRALAQQRVEMRTQREEVASLKALFTAWQARDENVAAVATEVSRAHIVAWGRSLARARVTRWPSLVAVPGLVLQRVIRRTLSESQCPPVLLERLMESCVEWFWPPAMRSIEERRRHRGHLELLICRRIPGKHAVVVLATDNPHMCEDFIQEPGYVVVFESGVEIHRDH